MSEEVISCKINPEFCSAKIRGLVNENDVSILVDTGSTVSIINEKLVRRSDLLSVKNVNITSASRDKIQIKGKLSVPFQIGKKCKCVYSVYVASNFPHQCIIGLDIVKRCSCCVDLGNNCVYVNHDKIMFENSDEMCVNEIEVHSLDGMELCVYSTDVLENTSFNVNESLSSNENEKLHVLLEKIESVFALHESTQETPFFLMHGRDPVLPVEAVMCPPTLSYSASDNYKDE